MPKISYYNSEKSSQSTEFTRNADPRTWAWNYPVLVQSFGDYTIGADTQDAGYVLYGIFPKTDKKILNEKSVLSAIEIEEIPGAAFDIPDIPKVAVIHNVATVEEARSKGWARKLYEFLLKKYKVLFSDTELFSDHGKESKSLGIWTKFLPSLGNVLNYNTKTKEYKEFNVDEGKSENVRFVVTNDQNIMKNMKESFSDWMKNGVKKATLTGLMSLPLVSMGDHTKPHKPIHAPPYPPPIEMPKYGENPFAKTPIPQKIETPKKLSINVDIIAQLESGGNSKIGTNRKGATGLCQLKKAAWDETLKSLYGRNGHRKYPYNVYAHNGKINKMVSDHYYNVIIPKHLEAFDLPINQETILAAYNWGSSNVKNGIRKYGEKWLRYAPKETQSYIERYKNIEKNM